ncbi:MAG TPA: hypothetical protein VFU38_03840, partial [Candidatus Krumholzibacteria bacterium]|nr:hypothetical protein [Candidatus Krumholzibacteria bacterium]
MKQITLYIWLVVALLAVGCDDDPSQPFFTPPIVNPPHMGYITARINGTGIFTANENLTVYRSLGS